MEEQGVLQILAAYLEGFVKRLVARLDGAEARLQLRRHEMLAGSELFHLVLQGAQAFPSCLYFALRSLGKKDYKINIFYKWCLNYILHMT
jgi:hypothetical protein